MERFCILIVILITFSCNRNSDYQQLNSCANYNLEPLENSNLKFNIQLPNNWSVEQNFMWGDTLSITAIDSININSKIRSFSILQYLTTVDSQINFEAIKLSFSERKKTILDQGKLLASDNEFEYLIIDDQFENEEKGVTLLLFKQVDNLVLNFVIHKETDNSELDEFCDFTEILRTVSTAHNTRL